LGRDVNRGDVCWYTFRLPDKKRPVLILTRDSAIAVLNSVTVAPITSTIRSIPTEVVLTKDDGMPDTCAANFDNLQTVPKSSVGNRITRLTARKMREARAAVSFALGFDDV
jgi:mRNA interferase MazF